MRIYGISTLVGGLLIIISFAFHPLLVNPWEGQHAMDEIAKAPQWIWDHGLMTIAVILWLLGLTGLERLVDIPSLSLRHAERLFIASLVVWLIVLDVEIFTLPSIVEFLGVTPAPNLRVAGGSMFNFTLAGGYLATALAWLGVANAARQMRKEQHLASWLTSLGYYLGILGVVGVALILWMPQLALILLIVTSVPVFLWTLWAGYRFMKLA